MVRYKYIKILLMLKGFTFHSPAPIPRPLLGLEGSKYNSCSGGLFVNPAPTYRREVWEGRKPVLPQSASWKRRFNMGS